MFSLLSFCLYFLFFSQFSELLLLHWTVRRWHSDRLRREVPPRASRAGDTWLERSSSPCGATHDTTLVGNRPHDGMDLRKVAWPSPQRGTTSVLSPARPRSSIFDDVKIGVLRNECLSWLTPGKHPKSQPVHKRSPFGVHHQRKTPIGSKKSFS